MKDMICSSMFFGVFISLAGYELGCVLKKKLKLAIFNPLLISIILVITVLLLLHIDYDTYYEGAKYLSYLPLSNLSAIFANILEAFPCPPHFHLFFPSQFHRCPRKTREHIASSSH